MLNNSATTPNGFPALRAEHLSNAQLFADRYGLVQWLGSKRSFPRLAEIGVALGSFSTFMVQHLRPAEFYAFDVFTMHEAPEHWGKPSSELFGGKTQRQHFESVMAKTAVKLQVEEGPSQEKLIGYPDDFLDLIYLDGDHTIHGVKADADHSVRIAKQDGVLIFNDYTMYDPFAGAHYGVVPVVNDLVVNHGWKVIGFALQHSMFCDIALARR